METKQNDYKPFSKRMYFVLNYKCINRECNIETTTHQEIDLMRVCLKCNDKHPHFMLKTFHDQFKKPNRWFNLFRYDENEEIHFSIQFDSNFSFPISCVVLRGKRTKKIREF